MARPDLTTVSIGEHRKRWVRESGFALSKAVQRLIDAEMAGRPRKPKPVSIEHIDTSGMSDDEIADLVSPQPIEIRPVVGAHGWTALHGRWIARPASLNELSQLVSAAPGPVRLAASHVLIVAEVNDA